MMGVDAIRDWPRTLPNASFKGFPFHVEREGVDDAGRAVAIHPFVMAEEHATEDLGRKPRSFGVLAYVVGNDADARAQTLVEICSSYGEGLLVLPIAGAQVVRCVGVSTNSEKDRLGRVEFQLRFVEAGLESGGFPAIPLLDRMLEDAMDLLPNVVEEIISGLP